MTAAALADLPPRLCECGCGKPTPIATRTCTRTGAVKGEQARFVRGHAGVLAAQMRRRDPGWRLKPGAPTVGETYAAALEGAAAGLVVAIRDEGPDAVAAAVRAALAVPAPPGVDPVVALCTVLGAQIDPDLPRSARLGWTDQLTGGAS